MSTHACSVIILILIHLRDALCEGIACRLLMIDHDCQPLFKIFLHTDTAAFQQILDSLNLTLQVFQFIIVFLVRHLTCGDLLLKQFFLISPYNFSILINQTSHSILSSYLFYLIRQVFNLGT